jgi:hypothetical protein
LFADKNIAMPVTRRRLLKRCLTAGQLDRQARELGGKDFLSLDDSVRESIATRGAATGGLHGLPAAAREMTAQAEPKHDVVIVGSGAGGGSLAWALSRR